jgi:hypothetical protein
MPLSTYLANKIRDHIIGKTSYTMPTVYLALFKIRAQSNNLRSTAVSVGDFTVPATPNGRLYRCTTAGTTGSGEPTWPTTDGGTVSDGTAVWTEHTPSLRAVTNVPECAYTSYARVALGTGGSSKFNAAASGAQDNSAAITFPQKTGGTDEMVGAWGTYDASTGGNLLEFGGITNPKLYSDGDSPEIAIGDLDLAAS